MSQTATPETEKPKRRRWPRVLLVIGLVLILLVGVAYVATAVMRVPAPHNIMTLLNTAPSQQGELLPSRTIPASQNPTTFEQNTDVTMPQTVPWKNEQLPLNEVLALTNTNAFVVLHDGEVVDEWYAEGITPETRLSSWSVAKSIVSLQIGQAIAAGKLSEDDLLVDVVPELKTGGDFDTVTIGDLLDMASGVDIPENYSELWPFTGTARLFLSEDLPSYIKAHRELTYEPGSQATYRSVDTLLLGMALAEVGGQPISDQLAENIWGPMGAQDSATWNLDREGGMEKAFCCINATAMDFARVGQMVLDDGEANGQQIISEEWIDRISTPAKNSVLDWGYSAQWWHLPGNDQDFSAIGIYGQYIYVNPEDDTTIVKLSDYGTEQDELETVNMMRAIAADLDDQS